MNIEEKAKEELLEAAENIDGADAFVLLIGYEDEHALSTIVGRAGDVLSLLVKALNHALSCHPSKEVLQGEFETLTGIFPDVLLYKAAEAEYNTGDWASKAKFCDCFKADEDGIAQKCRNAADERWLAEEELIGKLRAENRRLEDENENLRNEIGALADKVDELNDEIDAMPEQGVPKRIMMLATMMQALIAAAMDDNKADTILHQVWGYQYLLDELHEELKDK